MPNSSIDNTLSLIEELSALERAAGTEQRALRDRINDLCATLPLADVVKRAGIFFGVMWLRTKYPSLSLSDARKMAESAQNGSF